MKKILLFIDNLGSGGAQRQIVNTAILLKESGYDASLLVYQDIPFYKHLLDKHNIPVCLINAKGNFSRILKIRRYINKYAPDVVIAFLATPGFIACVSKIGRKKWKLVTTERSNKASTFTSKRSKFFNKFERFSDAKVGNSKSAIAMWEKHYPKYKDKYSVIYNHILVPKEYLNLNHEYKKNGKLNLLIAASYQELKNPIRFIEALNSLNEEQRAKINVNWYGKSEITEGNTKTYDAAALKISEYKLHNCIQLHDETKDIYRIMAESDAVGLFSTVEGLPNTICEAMTIGRPIIMSRVSDYDVLVSNNGFLCDPLSVESIRDALIKLINSTPCELENMGKASQENADKLFSKKVVTKQWTNLIEALS